jgi:hypothetical protein
MEHKEREHCQKSEERANYATEKADKLNTCKVDKCEL